MIGSEHDREQLAASLRTLREDSGLSTTKFAALLGWSQSKVSKSERGVTAPGPDDVAAWARASSADTATTERLVELAERVSAELTEWRRALAPGRRRLQEEIHRLESAASVTRVFAPDVVVGLAQTRPYAEAMFRLGRPPVPPDEVPELVDARLARHAVLDDPSKSFVLLMSEMAVRRRLLAADDMRDQLQWLVGLSERPNVDLGVIPFDAEERVHQYHGFAIIGDPAQDDGSLVLAETVTRSLTIRATAEINDYVAHFDELRLAALEGDALRAFLREVIDELSST